jgi:hypothetical protein
MKQKGRQQDSNPCGGLLSVFFLASHGEIVRMEYSKAVLEWEVYRFLAHVEKVHAGESG